MDDAPNWRQFIDGLDDDDLVRVWAAVMEELRSRGIVRSANNPTGDIGERVGAAVLSLTLTGGVSQGHDAVDADGLRYQIKAHRRAPGKLSRKAGVVRKLEEREFEYLIVVIFDSNLAPAEVWRMPHEVVVEHGVYVPTLNGHRMRTSVWTDPRNERIQ